MTPIELSAFQRLITEIEHAIGIDHCAGKGRNFGMFESLLRSQKICLELIHVENNQPARPAPRSCEGCRWLVFPDNANGDWLPASGCKKYANQAVISTTAGLPLSQTRDFTRCDNGRAWEAKQ